MGHDMDAEKIAQDIVDNACLYVSMASASRALEAAIVTALTAAYNEGVEDAAKVADGVAGAKGRAGGMCDIIGWTKAAKITAREIAIAIRELKK